MSIPSSAVRIPLYVALVAACSHPAPAPAPAPQPSPAPASAPAVAPPSAPASAPAAGAADLSGTWLYTATLGGSEITGTLQLVRRGASYAGTATASTADEDIPMTQMIFDGTRITMFFETANGEVRIEGTVTGGTIINGALALGGTTGTFRARKQQ